MKEEKVKMESHRFLGDARTIREELLMMELRHHKELGRIDNLISSEYENLVKELFKPGK